MCSADGNKELLLHLHLKEIQILSTHCITKQILCIENLIIMQGECLRWRIYHIRFNVWLVLLSGYGVCVFLRMDVRCQNTMDWMWRFSYILSRAVVQWQCIHWPILGLPLGHVWSVVAKCIIPGRQEVRTSLGLHNTDSRLHWASVGPVTERLLAHFLHFYHAPLYLY